MKKIIFVAILLTLFSGCSCNVKNDSEPPYPQNITGWKYREEDGVGVVGNFVLKKGESTNNGEVEIKVVNLIPAECFVDQGTMQAQKRAKLQFIRMSDRKVVCEDITPEHGGGNLCGDKLDEFRISGIGIRNINLKDQWVHFILTGASKK